MRLIRVFKEYYKLYLNKANFFYSITFVLKERKEEKNLGCISCMFSVSVDA
jgi:hypothetical protein